MKRWIFSLAFGMTSTLTHAVTQKMIDHAQLISPEKVSVTEREYLPPESVYSEHLSVKAMKIDGFSGAGLEKLHLAFKVLEMVVNTDEFKERVLNFKNLKGERRFSSNRGLSNEDIFHQFMEGRETLQPNTPGEMNFFLRLYNRPWSKVIGYTSGETNLININLKFFKNYRPSDVAANLAHEWTHKIGFDHKSAQEHDSAPYAIGHIVGDIAKKILKTNQLH